MLVMALVVGIGAGVALTAFAGARRSDTAVPRFVDYSLPDDGGFIYGNVFTPLVSPGAAGYSLALAPAERRVVDLPQVAAWFRAPYLYLTTDRSGANTRSMNVIGAADKALFRTVDRPLVVAGRLPDPDHPFEAVVNEFAAAKRRVHVGSTIPLYAYSAQQFAGGNLTGVAESAHTAPAGPGFTVRVTGIVRSPSDVNAIVPLAERQDVSYEGQQNLYLSPAFLPRLAAGLGIPVQQIPNLNLVGVRLRHGAADWRAFSAAAAAVGGGVITPSAGDVFSTRSTAASAQRGVHLLVVALLLFGALAALVTVVLVGQAVARQVAVEGDDYVTMRSLGATRPQVVAVVVLRAAAVGVVGGILAFAVAAVASPLMPIGLARQAEIHLGFDVDLAILAPAVLGIAALLGAWSVLPAWRVSRRSALTVGDDGSDVRPSRVVEAMTRASLPPAALVGVRFGLEPGRGRGPTAPVATAVVGAVVAVTALVAALTFGSSLTHLVDTPRQQGWNWDALVGNPNDQTDREAQAGAMLAHNPLVGSYSAIAILAGHNQGTAVIDGKTVDSLLAIDPMKGSVYPPILEGRAPRAGDEIVIATHTLRQLHRRVGGSVHIPTPAGTLTLHIVGRMLSPSVGDLFTNGLGDGAWAYGPAVRQVQAQQSQQANGPPPIAFVLFAVRYAPGASPQAAYASLRRDFGRTVLRALPGQDAVNLQSVDRLPFVLAVLVVLIGIVTVGNQLLTSVRRRRRDLAILKTIGFVRRQVADAVTWQAASFGFVSVVVGIPLGIVAGRWGWDLVASNIGSVSPALVPALWVALVAPGALGVVIVAAALPGWSAARVRPAVVMRSE